MAFQRLQDVVSYAYMVVSFYNSLCSFKSPRSLILYKQREQVKLPEYFIYSLW